MPRGGTTTHDPQRPSRRPCGGLRWRFMAAEVPSTGAEGSLTLGAVNDNEPLVILSGVSEGREF